MITPMHLGSCSYCKTHIACDESQGPLLCHSVYRTLFHS
jgi:hypothetical protein